MEDRVGTPEDEWTPAQTMVEDVAGTLEADWTMMDLGRTLVEETTGTSEDEWNMVVPADDKNEAMRLGTSEDDWTMVEEVPLVRLGRPS